MTTITRHRADVSVYDDSGGIGLVVVGGQITLDETWAPHVQATLRVTLPSEATLARLDPRSGNKVGVLLYRFQDGVPTILRSIHLHITGRSIDRAEGTVVVECASAEAILQRTTNATNVPDDIAFNHQDSLRAIINNAVLAQAGLPFLSSTPDVDADMSVLVDSENLFENPSAEVDLTGAVGSNLTLVRQTGAPPFGSAMFRLNTPTSTDSYFTVGGNGGDLRNGMQPGVTYTVSASLLLGGALTGTMGPNARRIVVYTRRGSAGYVTTSSAPAPNAAGTTRLSVTFTVPEGATEAFIRFYHGYSTGSGSAFWDGLKLVEHVPGDLSETTYFDGDTTSTDQYVYSWTGTPGLSRSIRTALVERTPEALVIPPGGNLWDFASNLVQSAGMRLYSDAEGSWRLVPADYTTPGMTVLRYDDLIRYDESLDLAGDTEWADAAVVTYRWRDWRGDQQERVDAYSSVPTPKRTMTVELEQPYPGPGLAAYIVSRALGRGEDVSLTAIAHPLVTPSQPFSVSKSDGTSVGGMVRRVSFDLDSDEMSIQTRGITAIPTTSWLALPAGQAWTASPVGATWIGETVG